MKIKIITVLLLLSSILFAQVQWEQDLKIRQGVNIEWFRSASNFGDNVVYVWSDTKEGGRDLYAQKVDALGNLLWNNGEPILIDAKIDRQEDPVVIETNDNCIVVAWVDFSNDTNYSDIYAQKINAAGELLWQENGVALSVAADIQIGLNIVPNALGGAIIIWQDFRNAGGVDIYGASVDADGNNTWDFDGTPIANENGAQSGHTFWEDGNGGAIMAYVNDLSGDKNIVSKGIASDGTISWTTMICNYQDGATTIDQQRVKSAKDGEGGFIFAWQDKRNINTDLYAQRINADGQIQWAENGIQITDYDGEDLNPRLCTSSDTGAFLSWESGSAAASDLNITKISNAGVNLWNNIVVSDAENAQNNPRVSGDNNGGVYVTWEDSRNGNYPNIDIYSQHLDSDGAELWEAGGLAVCDQPGPQIGNAIKVNNGNIFINWSDSRNGSIGLFYQVYNSAGVMALDLDGEQIFWGLSGNSEEINTINTNDGKYFAWADTRKGYLGKQLFVQKIDADGNTYFAENGNEVTEKYGESSQEFLQAIPHHENGIALTWQEQRDVFPRVYFQHMDQDGNIAAQYGIAVTTEADRDQKKPHISELNGEYYIVWEDMDNNWSQNIYAQKITDNEIQWANRGIQVDFAPMGQGDLVLFDVVKNYVIYSKTFMGDIYVKALNPDGTTVAGFPETGLPICIDPTSQSNAKGIMTDEGILIIWEDLRNDDSDIYGQMITTDGEILWEENGVPLVQAVGDQKGFIAMTDGDDVVISWEDLANDGTADIAINNFDFDGVSLWPELYAVERDSTQQSIDIEKIGENYMIVYEDLATEMSDIYMQFVNTSGNISSDSDFGIVLCDASKKQYTPKIMKVDEDTAIVGWIDGRSSGKEEIKGLFAQKIVISGVDNEEDNVEVPSMELSNYPNPFNPSTSIKFNIESPQEVTLEVFNIRGQLVKTLVNDDLAEGYHTIKWNGNDNNDNRVSSGLYMYKLSTEKKSQTNKMLLLK